MRFILAGTLFLVAVGFQLYLISIFGRMKMDVNGILPEGSRIHELDPSLLQGVVITTHRRYFPESTLRQKLYRAWLIEVTAFILSLACVIRIR